MNFKFCFSFFVLCTISWQFSSAMNEKKAIRNCVFKRKIKQDILHQQLPQNVTFNQILANNNLMKPNIQAMLNTTINVVHWYKLSLKQNIQNEKELKKETEIYKSKTNAQCSEVDTDNGTSGDLNKTICLQDRWVTDETLINFFCASSSSSKNSKQKNTIFSPDFLEWGCDDDEKDTSKSFYYITLPDGQTGNKTLYFSKDNNLFTKIITAFCKEFYLKKNKKNINSKKTTPTMQKKLNKLNNDIKQLKIGNQNQLNLQQKKIAEQHKKIINFRIAEKREAVEKQLNNRPEILFWTKHMLPIIVGMGIVGLILLQVLLWSIRQYFELHPHIITWLKARGGLFTFLGLLCTFLTDLDITNKKHWSVYMVGEATLLIGILCIALFIDHYKNASTNDWIKEKIDAVTIETE